MMLQPFRPTYICIYTTYITCSGFCDDQIYQPLNRNNTGALSVQGLLARSPLPTYLQSKSHGGLPKLGVPFLRPRIRTVVFGGLYWGLLFWETTL